MSCGRNIHAALGNRGTNQYYTTTGPSNPHVQIMCSLITIFMLVSVLCSWPSDGSVQRVRFVADCACACWSYDITAVNQPTLLNLPLHLDLITTSVSLGHPVLRRDPQWGCRLFFFLLFLLPPPNMAFPEAKHNEGNLVLTWYFRKTFL